ncbi:MAG: hypothetical protein IBJ03_18270 [Gemmatimonadaceae bacterium]|nr:hypothetical protein [Gemmatimonadaceae bacterium]
MLKPILILAFTVAAAAQTSVAGDWDMTYSTPGGPRTYRIKLKTDGDKVTGTVQRPTGEVPLTGEIRRDSVFFTYSIVYNDSPLAMNVAAKVAESKMTGSIAFAGQMQEALTATRVPAKP